MFSKDLESAIGNIYKECRSNRRKLMTVESLLLGLLDSPGLRHTLEGLKVPKEDLKKSLSRHIEKEVPKLAADDDGDTEPTLGFQRVLQRAVYHVQSSGNKEVTVQNVLVAIYGERDSKAVELLTGLGVSRLDVVNFVSHGIERPAKSETEKFRERVSEIIIQDLNPPARASAATKKRHIFISYCHADEDCLRRIMVHLGPLVRENSVDCWSDRKIRPGNQWRQDIAKNLDEADIAILLITADFLASEFIVTEELPTLLLKADERGLRILPVILKPCGFLRDKVLSSFQCVNDPREPLLGLSHIGQEAIYDRIADEVHNEISARRAQ